MVLLDESNILLLVSKLPPEGSDSARVCSKSLLELWLIVAVNGSHHPTGEDHVGRNPTRAWHQCHHIQQWCLGLQQPHDLTVGMISPLEPSDARDHGVPKPIGAASCAHLVDADSR